MKNKTEYKLDKWDRKWMRLTPKLDDLLTKGKISIITKIDDDLNVNFIRVNLWNVVPAGFNNKFMCMQQQSTACRRKVRVTVELI